MSTNPMRKPAHQKLPSREPLTPSAIEQLIDAAKQHKTNGRRDAALIHLMYQFGLRVNEAIALSWNQLDLDQGTINVIRSKERISSRHPLGSRELQLLQSLREEQSDSHYVFSAKTNEPLTTTQIQGIFRGASIRTGIAFRVTPHNLRFAAAHRNQPTG